MTKNTIYLGEVPYTVDSLAFGKPIIGRTLDNTTVAMESDEYNEVYNQWLEINKDKILISDRTMDPASIGKKKPFNPEQVKEIKRIVKEEFERTYHLETKAEYETRKRMQKIDAEALRLWNDNE